MEMCSPLLRGVLGTIHATLPQSPTAWPSFVNQKKKKGHFDSIWQETFLRSV